MAEMKTLNGYEVVDAAARAEIELLKAKEPDLSGYYTKSEVDAKDAAVQTNLDSHNHDTEYAPKVHNHDNEYASKTHNHDNDYAPKTHNHSYNDLTDKPTIPSTEGLATETYVDEAIATIPKPSGMELVEVTTDNTAEEIQAILDAGKCPIFEGVMAYQGASTPYFDGQPGEKFHLFAGVTLMTTYPNDGNLYPTLRVAKCYPGRTGSQWSETATPTSPTGYRLVTIVEFNELKNRVAALEGGNN